MRIAFSSFIRCFEKSVRTENWLCSHSAKPVPTGSNIRQRRDPAGYSRSAQCDAPCSGRARKFRVRSAQIRNKHRNLRQAILSESAHTLFVYARSMRAVSMLCSLRPLLASSIITKPDLLPVGFAGLRHLGRWLSATGLFCLEYAPSPFQDAEVALWSNHGRSVRAEVHPGSRLNSK